MKNGSFFPFYVYFIKNQLHNGLYQGSQTQGDDKSSTEGKTFDGGWFLPVIKLICNTDDRLLYFVFLFLIISLKISYSLVYTRGLKFMDSKVSLRPV